MLGLDQTLGGKLEIGEVWAELLQIHEQGAGAGTAPIYLLLIYCIILGPGMFAKAGKCWLGSSEQHPRDGAEKDKTLQPHPVSPRPFSPAFAFLSSFTLLSGGLFTLPTAVVPPTFPTSFSLFQAGFVARCLQELFTGDFLPWPFPPCPNQLLKSLFWGLPLKVGSFYWVSITFTPPQA